MARPSQEILEALLADKDLRPELLGLDSQSDQAVWRGWLHVIATGHHQLEELFDLFQEEVEERKKQLRALTLPWYVMMAKTFQYDSSGATAYYYVFNEYGQPGYNAINTDHQIVKYASATETVIGQVAVVRLKVAKQVSNAPAPLTSTELTAFTAFVNRFKAAGTRTEVTSLPADELQQQMVVYYDPTLNPDELRPRIIAARNALVDPTNQELYDAALYAEKLENAVQAVPGVNSTRHLLCRLQPANIDLIASRYAVPQSGYVRLDTAFPWESNQHLTLIPSER